MALSAVVGVIAGIVGTARAMFLSQHDFEVTLWVVGAAGVVSLGFALAVARMAVRDSRAVEEATRALGEHGSFVAPEGTSSELSRLSAQLAETSAKLAEANERERALETSRRELVAWVSHDLRTPLAGLRAMAEALEDGIAEDPQRYHQQMRETVDRMARMVDDLFELSRIHSGALQLSLEVVPVEDAISEALAVSGPVAQAKSVRLDGFAEPGVAVRADPRELARMIGNLVTNAIRHTPSEGAGRGERPGQRRRRAVLRGRPVRRHPGGRPRPGVRRRLAGESCPNAGSGRRLGSRSRDRARHRRGTPRHRAGGQRRRGLPVPRRAAHLSR